jgi:hypothetical protein
MDPTRVELDMPVVIINQYGHLHLDNLKDVNDVVGAFFGKGSVITLHIVAEDTGQTRGFCKYESTNNYGKSVCNFTLRSDGTCVRQDEHDKDLAKQLSLPDSEESE